MGLQVGPFLLLSNDIQLYLLIMEVEMNTLTRRIYIVLLFLLYLYTRPTLAGEFAVSPMMIDIDGVSRSTQEFSFTLFGKSNTNIKLSLFEMNQLESGYMGFTESPVDDMDSIASWIELEDNRYRLRPDVAVQVRGRIRIPSKATGTYLIAIMVEEDIPLDEKGGVSVKIRYAVILNLDVQGRNTRIRTTFEELYAVEREDGIYLQGYFTNESGIEEWLFSEIQLRDENNRLLERVQLKTESAWQRHDTGSRVFPGAKVLVYGKINRPFVSGNYRVLARNNFAGKNQSIYRDTIHLQTREVDELTEGGILQDTQTLGLNEVVINPEKVQVAIRNNGTSFSSFLIVNNKEQAVEVTLLETLENLEPLGISQFQFYPKTLTLRPNQRTRVVLKQTHIEAAEYGNIAFSARVNIQGDSQDSSVLEIPTILTDAL